MEWILVSLASALAGFVDAIVGGGGLILVPAMFAAFPSTAPATLFGTNKSAAVWGTAISAWQYSKRVHITWATLLPAIATTLVGAFSEPGPSPRSRRTFCASCCPLFCWACCSTPWPRRSWVATIRHVLQGVPRC